MIPPAINVCRLVCVVFVGILLSGCGGEPSELQIKTALEANLSASKSSIQSSIFGAALLGLSGIRDVRLDSLEKVGCEQTGDNAYQCQVIVQITVHGDQQGVGALFGITGSHKQALKVTMLKSSQGWYLVE